MSTNSSDLRPRLWVVASHSQAVAASDSVDPCRVIAVPAFLTLAQDVQGFECRHLDLEFSGDRADVAHRANLVVNELEALAPEPEVAFRGGTRLAPNFSRVGFPPPDERRSALKRGGLYLVTGGLGGVGAELCRHLLKTWDSRLLIIGRTPVEPAAASSDSASDPGRQKRELLAELSQLGAVRYRALDIRDSAKMESAVDEVEAELGQPLTGVFHLASVYRERPVTEESTASFASAIASKVDGAIALHELLARRPEAFIVCFSSVVSFFSAAGNAAYAAANRFVDAYCHEQRHRNRRKSYSIDWSVWDGIAAEGAAQEILSQLGNNGEGGASAAEISARLAEAGKARGYLRIPVTQGMRSLIASLSLPPGQLLVGVDVTNPNLENATSGDPEPLLGIRGAFTLRSPADELDAAALVLASAHDRFGQTVPLELRSLPSLPLLDEGLVDREAVLAELRGGSRTIVLPQTQLEQQLAEIWKEVLGLESLGITESFFDLGGTSLLSVRLFAEIERRIGVSLQLATLFQAATIQALAKLLEAKLATTPLSTLTMLVEATGEPALFLIHDIDGQTAVYQSLASHLAPEVRVYGIAPYSKDRFSALHTRIDDMVRYYVDKLREVQPSGPYLVGGSGTGGALAFEVACRLQALGEEVALVALLDAADATLRIGFPRLVQNGLAKLLGRPTQLGELARRLAQSGFNQVRVRLLDSYVSRGTTPPWFLEFIPPRVVYGYAIAGHHPSHFRGRLTLFRATSGKQDDLPGRERYGDDQLGWNSRSTAGVDLVDVAGGHLSMLDEPHVADLAKKLRARIGEAYRTKPDPSRLELRDRQPISAA
jgi:thioesterase domain-containing protein/NAD(P)-dependent dehydrogenase (short-subunit alcohol dehydrogenase family)/acyl carrier protein